MEHRHIFGCARRPKRCTGFFAGHGSGGPATGNRIAALRWTSGMDVRTGNASNPKSFCIEKCTTSGVFTLGDTRVFAERFGAGARLVICGGGHVAAAAVRLAKLLDLPLPGWKIVRNMQMHCGKQGRIECSVRHLKRLWRRYRAVQRHTFVY